MRKMSHKEKNIINSGRIAQKMKTREKLLLAANSMIIEGKEFSIEMVANRAGISKATAYRYFSNKEILQREASLHIKSEVKENLFAGIGEEDLHGRLDKLIEYHYDILFKNEVEFRLHLSAAIQASIQNKENYSRAGRRILLIEESLVSLRAKISKDQFTKMVCSISIILGIESVTILKDLCHLKKKAVLETWKWMINKIVF